MDRASRLQPLGLQRLRALDCLGGNTPRAPGFFELAESDDIFAAFRTHTERLSRDWASASDPATVALLATARLLIGDLAAAEVILDHLPAQPIKLDHGAGKCLVLPFHALAAVLPWPADLTDTKRWLAGSAEQTALRDWLAAHRDRLRWLEADGVYR